MNALNAERRRDLTNFHLPPSPPLHLQGLDDRTKELNVLFHVLAAGSPGIGNGKALLRCQITPSVLSNVLTQPATAMASVTLERVDGGLFTSDRWALLVTVAPAGLSESLRDVATESHSEPLLSRIGDRDVCIRAPIPAILLDHGIPVEISCFLSYKLPQGDSAEVRPAEGGISTGSRLLLVKLESRVLDVLDFVRPRTDGAPVMSSVASTSREVVETFNRRGDGPLLSAGGTTRNKIAMRLVVHRDHALATIDGAEGDPVRGDLSAQLLQAILAGTCFAGRLADAATACSGITLHGATFKLAAAPRGEGARFFEIAVHADSSVCDELYLACARRVHYDAPEAGAGEACTAASLRAMRGVIDAAKVTEQALLHQAANPQPRSSAPGLAPGSTPIAPLHDKLVQLVTGTLHATTGTFA